MRLWSRFQVQTANPIDFGDRDPIEIAEKYCDPDALASAIERSQEAAKIYQNTRKPLGTRVEMTIGKHPQRYEDKLEDAAFYEAAEEAIDALMSGILAAHIDDAGKWIGTIPEETIPFLVVVFERAGFWAMDAGEPLHEESKMTSIMGLAIEAAVAKLNKLSQGLTHVRQFGEALGNDELTVTDQEAFAATTGQFSNLHHEYEQRAEQISARVREGHYADAVANMKHIPTPENDSTMMFLEGLFTQGPALNVNKGEATKRVIESLGGNSEKVPTR